MKGMHHHIDVLPSEKWPWFTGHGFRQLWVAWRQFQVQETPSPGVGASTQALWAAANLQQTRQIGPSAVPMLVPEMILSASHWVQLLQFCKELEDCHQYWFAQKEDVNASIATLWKEMSQFLEGLEADYKEKVSLISLAVSTWDFWVECSLLFPTLLYEFWPSLRFPSHRLQFWVYCFEKCEKYVWWVYDVVCGCVIFYRWFKHSGWATYCWGSW